MGAGRSGAARRVRADGKEATESGASQPKTHRRLTHSVVATGLDTAWANATAVTHGARNGACATGLPGQTTVPCPAPLISRSASLAIIEKE